MAKKATIPPIIPVSAPMLVASRSFSTCNPAREMRAYFSKWNSLPDYVSQENALNMIFLGNGALGFSEPELMVKCATLNDFYSTYIFKVYYVVKHYLSVANLQNRLRVGDVSLVDDLRKVPTPRSAKPIDFYSFATKFCSHHNPSAYPICDKLAIKALYEFKKRDGFCKFTKTSLTDYRVFIAVIDAFRDYYGLQNYSYKDIDKYLWQVGKELDEGVISLP